MDLGAVLPLTAAVDDPADDHPGAADIPGEWRAVAVADLTDCCIFAATDAHADIVVSAVKKAFAAKYGEIDDAAVKKITGSVDNVRTLIRSFRNDASPKIAVTVDLLTTGVDVPAITNLVFLRRVNSRILYEQMIGRATRPCPEIGKEVFRIFDAVDPYPHLENGPARNWNFRRRAAWVSSH